MWHSKRNKLIIKLLHNYSPSHLLKCLHILFSMESQVEIIFFYSWPTWGQPVYSIHTEPVSEVDVHRHSRSVCGDMWQKGKVKAFFFPSLCFHVFTTFLPPPGPGGGRSTVLIYFLLDVRGLLNKIKPQGQDKRTGRGRQVHWRHTTGLAASAGTEEVNYKSVWVWSRKDRGGIGRSGKRRESRRLQIFCKAICLFIAL